LRRQLEAEIFADAPDAQKSAGLQDQLVQAQAQRLAKEIATEQKIAQVLTAEQRAKIRDRLAQQPARGARGPAGQASRRSGDRRRG
jgi:Spy/CpxP family protein refolding chaperone